jgi:hypothetical protein
MGLNQALKHDFAGLFKPIHSQDIAFPTSSAMTTAAIISTGHIIDRLAETQAFESAVGLVSCRYFFASSVGSITLGGYFFHDTTSGFGTAVALGSTTLFTLESPAANSTVRGVLKASQDLSSANRYIQFRHRYQASTAPAGGEGAIQSMVLLCGADELPCS